MAMRLSTSASSIMITQQSWASFYIATKRATKPISPAHTRPIWIRGELPLAGTGASLGASSSDNGAPASSGDGEISGAGEVSDEGEASDEGEVSDDGDICFLDAAGAFAAGVSDDGDGDDADGAFSFGADDGASAFGADDEAGDDADFDDCPSMPGAIIGLVTWRIEML